MYKHDQLIPREGAILTYTGRMICPLDPDPHDICLEDIAHSLAYTCRFSGHTKSFWSVAQHSLLVSYFVPNELQCLALLHDAAEAYLTDIPRPFKHLLKEYKAAENQLMDAIFVALGMPFTHKLPDEIKAADNRALALEQYWLMPHTEAWPLLMTELEANEDWPKLHLLEQQSMAEIEHQFIKAFDLYRIDVED